MVFNKVQTRNMIDDDRCMCLKIGFSPIGKHFDGELDDKPWDFGGSPHD